MGLAAIGSVDNCKVQHWSIAECSRREIVMRQPLSDSSIAREARGTIRCPARARFIGKRSLIGTLRRGLQLTEAGSQPSDNLTRLRSRDHAGEIRFFLALGR